MNAVSTVGKKEPVGYDLGHLSLAIYGAEDTVGYFQGCRAYLKFAIVYNDYTCNMHSPFYRLCFTLSFVLLLKFVKLNARVNLTLLIVMLLVMRY